MATIETPEKAAPVTVRALTPIRHDGELVPTGDTLKLPPSDADALVAAGFAERVGKAK